MIQATCGPSGVNYYCHELAAHGLAASLSSCLRGILGTQWNAATWAQIRLEIPKALALKATIQRAGRFN